MSGNQGGAAAEIGRAEQSRCQALKDADRAALSELLADEFLYVHGSGRVEDKKAYIAGVTSGKAKYVDFSRSDEVVTPYGDTALASGAIRVTSMRAEGESTKSFRYASLWAKNGGKWRLAFWQNTATK